MHNKHHNRSGENTMKKQLLYWGIALVLSVLGTNVFAGGVSGLTTFSAGATAKASEVNGNFSTIQTSVNGNAADIATNAAATAAQTTAITNNTSGIATNAAATAAQTTAITNNTSGIATNSAAIANNTSSITSINSQLTGLSPKHTGVVYRWTAFSTYSQVAGWYANNSPEFFGGINPQVWTDGNAVASQLSADKEVLRTLFTQKGYGGKNAVVFADERYFYSSTDGKIAAALFRIKNTTASAIDWTPSVNFTAYYLWGETASVALNGNLAWTSGTSILNPTSAAISIPLSIPANRTSTAIFVSASSAPNGTRSTFLAFGNNSLALPAGLEYIDDFDTATGNWSQ
jgi:hypothetical protein